MVRRLIVIRVLMIGAMTLMSSGYESVRAEEVLDSGKFVTGDGDHDKGGP